MDRDGVVGRSFFEEHASTTGARFVAAPPGAGFLASMDELASDHFQPEKLDPLVRAVWEETTTLVFDLVGSHWGSFARPFKPLLLLLARGMKQLVVPEVGDAVHEMENSVFLMDADRNMDEEYRVWVRTHRGEIFYAGAVFSHHTRDRGADQSYLDVILPLYRANAPIVFQPFNVNGGGLVVRTHHRGSFDAGCHLVIPGRRRYWMAPFFGIREEIELTPHGEGTKAGVRAVAKTRWLWFESFTLTYWIVRRSAAE